MQQEIHTLDAITEGLSRGFKDASGISIVEHALHGPRQFQHQEQWDTIDQTFNLGARYVGAFAGISVLGGIILAAEKYRPIREYLNSLFQ